MSYILGSDHFVASMNNTPEECIPLLNEKYNFFSWKYTFNRIPTKYVTFNRTYKAYKHLSLMLVPFSEWGILSQRYKSPNHDPYYRAFEKYLKKNTFKR